ncbi:hypothetical protein NDU88_000672 [Pleurodeles waltl]|uniref:Uncharacterized protein n=1 Tax=Pleurodeles waltl TaxID=8319 RepID=A0AAV7MHI9_PLEWA|nr:hypothetical protein NDU88_000672 [Pleurodeles waltl]
MITSATAILGSGRPYGLPLRVGSSEVPGRGQHEECRPLNSPHGLCLRGSLSRWSSRLSFSGLVSRVAAAILRSGGLLRFSSAISSRLRGGPPGPSQIAPSLPAPSLKGGDTSGVDLALQDSCRWRPLDGAFPQHGSLHEPVATPPTWKCVLVPEALLECLLERLASSFVLGLL